MPNVTPATAGEAATSTAPRTIVARIMARGTPACRAVASKWPVPEPVASGRQRPRRPPAGAFEAQHHRGACWACRAASDGSAPQGEGARPAHEIEQLGPGGALDAAARDGAADRPQDPAQLAVQCGTLTGDGLIAAARDGVRYRLPDRGIGDGAGRGDADRLGHGVE